MRESPASPHGGDTAPDGCPSDVHAHAVTVLGKKWHLSIVRHLLEREPLRFNEIADAITPITNKVLSECLNDLGDHEIVERRVVQEKPVAVEYSLTERGADLEPVVRAVGEWARTHLRGDPQ